MPPHVSYMRFVSHSLEALRLKVCLRHLVQRIHMTLWPKQCESLAPAEAVLKSKGILLVVSPLTHNPRGARTHPNMIEPYAPAPTNPCNTYQKGIPTPNFSSPEGTDVPSFPAEPYNDTKPRLK